MHFGNRLVKTPTRCGEHFAKLLVWWRKGAALPVDWLVESGSASCAARFGSIPHGRGRGHSRGCICAPHAYLCSPLSTIRCVCATCDRRRLLLLLWSSIDEQARPDAAARCSVPACIARSDQAHREQRHMSALPRFRWALVAPRWLRWLPRALHGSPGQQSTGSLRLAGTGR